ncbi:MAG: alcohol dehydrogenase catalytic domain-containing protein, partial [Pseudolabrys sp.]
NAADSKVRQGGGRYTLNQFPHILCRDFSGVVSTLGERVTEFAVGDEVFGVVPDHRSLILAPCFANGWCTARS